MMVSLTREEVVKRENHTNLGNILVAVLTRLQRRQDMSQEGRKESRMTTRVLA